MSHTLASWRRTLTLIMALAVMAGLMVGISTAPAEASLGQVCKVRVTFAIGGDDIRGNTIIQVAAGGKSFTVSAGIGDWTTDVREGEFSGCISHSELKTTGFLITSISNPSWPETTDNWNLRGISIIDPDTGRGYFTQLLSGDDIHRFTGEEPSFRFNVEVDEQKPFFDHRYAHCSDDQMFARFVDPLNPNNP